MTPDVKTADPTRARAGDPCLLRRQHLYSKLKPGRGLAAEEVWANQRVRLQAATIDLVAERGFAGLTVRRLVRTSGVSTKTFYEHFQNVEECFASTYRAVLRFATRALAGDEGESDPLRRLRGGLDRLLRQVAADPAPARLVLVDAFDGGPALIAEAERSVDVMAGGIATALRNPAAAGSPPPLRCVVVVTGIECVIRKRLRDGRHEQLAELADEIADWAMVVLSTAEKSLRTQARPVLPLRLAQGAEATFHAADFGPAGAVRSRSLAATANLALREGYWRLTAARICEEAAVSRREFGRLFGDVSEPFLDALETLAVNTAASAWRAGRESCDWREGVASRTEAVCRALIEDPRIGKLFFLDGLEPGGQALRRQEALIATATAELSRAVPRSQPRGGPAAEALVAGAIGALRSAAVSGDRVYLRAAASVVVQALLASLASY